ncbi:MAG: hypothetical protein QOF78_896 [Phycisphaerales bacterium]|jgi:hypothetical protein|nr:hypothetical protein [Phycisphaerales bacterium]
MTIILPDDFPEDFEADTAVVGDRKAQAEDAQTAARVGSVGRARWLARYAHIVIPLLILVLLAAPSVTFLLPATEDYLGEIYQPVQALKFFKSRGTAFHKYGPGANFILAPGYAATLAYWKATGAFAHPSERFPYGFSRPFEQMGFLILQSRAIFLLIAVVALGYLAHTLQVVTANRWAVGFALLFCVATNYALVEQLPSPRPDSGMIAFSALALAMYVRMLFVGLTVRRGVWFSIWAVLAMSCKELAAPMFVMPFLGLIWIAYQHHNDIARRTIRWSFITGVLAYALLNIVYAPHTWLARMRFWLAGPGIDADVWGHGGGPIGRVVGVGQCLLDNLGPGGVFFVAIALIAFLIARPQRWVMLLLPAISVTLLGLAKIQYPADRFYTILCLALLPAVAVGLDELMRRSSAKRVVIAGMLVLGAANFWFASFSFFRHDATFEFAAERHALAQNDRAAKYYLLNNYPHLPGSTRLEYLGLKHDSRSVQQLAATRTNLPDWAYATHGKLQFLEDARQLPARAAMIRKDSGFDVATWSGMEGLGYQHEQTITPQTPRWFPFAWMPAVQRWRAMGAVEVYRLPPATTLKNAADSAHALTQD